MSSLLEHLRRHVGQTPAPRGAKARGRVARLNEAGARQAELAAALELAEQRSRELDDELRVLRAERDALAEANQASELRERTAGEQLAAVVSTHARLVAEHERVTDRLAVRARQVQELRASRLHRLSLVLWQVWRRLGGRRSRETDGA